MRPRPPWVRASVFVLVACVAASADGARDAAFAPRPDPALVHRVRAWVARLGVDQTAEARATLKARLAGASRHAATELGAGIPPLRDALEAAQRAKDEAAQRLAVGAILDLLELLGASRAPDALEPLVRAASDATWTDTLRQRATVALGALGDPRAVEALVRLRGEPAIEYTAGKALLALERFEAVPQWIALVDHPNQELATQAHQQLQRWSGEKLPREGAAWTRYFRDYPEGFKQLAGFGGR